MKPFPFRNESDFTTKSLSLCDFSSILQSNNIAVLHLNIPLSFICLLDAKQPPGGTTLFCGNLQPDCKCRT